MTTLLRPSWLALEESLGSRPVLTGTVPEIRQQIDGLSAALAPLAPPRDDSIAITEESFKSSADGSTLKIRVYTPKDLVSGKQLPIGIFYHGGGFVAGNLNTEDNVAYEISKASNSIVIQPEYHSAPEYKWPTLLSDFYDAYLWLLSNCQRLGGDESRIFVSGSSAGGTAATAVTLKARDEGTSKIKGQVLWQPLLLHPSVLPDDKKHLFQTWDRIGNVGAVVTPEVLTTMYESYKPSEHLADKYIFPYLSPSHKDLPPAYIAYNGEDVLGDHGLRYGELLEANGIAVKTKLYEGLPHFWTAFPQLKEEFAEFSKDLADGVQFVLQ